LTPYDDVHRGCIVRYKYSPLENRYRENAIITASGDRFQTNVSGVFGSNSYQEFVDSISSQNDRPLVVEARYIQTQSTAERLCKWMTLLHGRRRQMIEFDATMEAAAEYTPGDIVYVNMPQIRAFASGDSLEYSPVILGIGNDIIESTSTTYWPSGDSAQQGLAAAHQDDMLVIDDGTYAGTYRINWTGGGWSVTGHSIFEALGSTTSIASPWRVLPSFDVLSAQVVYDSSAGARVHIKAVEHPVLLPSNDDL
jgi:hypothetical protein